MRKLANSLVAAILSSPLHRLLSGSLMLLTVRGRRSGEEHSFPVQYAREDDRVYVYPANHERKQWWRNLLEPSPVRVRIAGEDAEGLGRTLLASDDPDGVAAGTRVYLARFPKLAGVVAGEMIVRVDLRS